MKETYSQFNKLVIDYYNQYHATEAETLQRRIHRNYINNNISIKQNNKNYFINNNSNKKYYFYNPPGYSYAFIEYSPINNKKKIEKYILINNCWCKQTCFFIPKNTNLQTYVLGCPNQNKQFNVINFNGNIDWYYLPTKVQQKYKIQLNRFGSPNSIY